MVQINVRRALAADKEAVIAALTLAFSADPPTRWLFPKAGDYLADYARLAVAFGGAAFEAGTALMTDDGAAAALWLPPGSTPDGEALGEVIGAATAGRGGSGGGEIGEQLAPFHPTAAHWYLPLIGVDPARHGQGLGSALLKAGLALCDAERLPAYLESSNRKNIPLYERFGFEVMGLVQSGDFPGLWPMSRPARD